MGHAIGRLARDANGAVAPTVALSLFALIAIGGIAFDYARLAAMDTELQDAADQAALAAASQLDGQSGACARAAAAASNLLANKTLFAKTSTTTGTNVEVPTSGVADCTGNSAISFYQSYNRVTDTPGLAATADSNAKIVIVSITPREAFYALTPIVAAFDARARRSGQIGAQAVAALSSAICKMPPLMICNPAETGSNTTFNPANYIGDGLRLTSVGNGGGTWAPGNFGYLDTQTGVNGAPDLRQGLGWNNPPGECISTDGVDTKPGATVTVTDAINTRFDIYDSNVSCPAGGSCSASINSVKDVRRPANANNAGNGCRLQNQGWQLQAGYYGETVPTTAAALPTTTTPTAMGHPRDECHAVSSSGTCANGRIGDGLWDADAYFRTNYVRTSVGANGEAIGTYWTSGTGVGSWQYNTGLSATASRTITGTTTPNPNYPSRYNVYAWEMSHRSTVVDGVNVLGPRDPSATGSTLVSYGLPQCSASQGYGSGQIPNATTPDRRRVSVAVVNCLANSVNGSSDGVPVEKWIDVFLVEPSVNRARTNNGDLYVEVIGEALTGGSGQTAGQVIRHDAPYLIK
jgi:Flp pilus assembly protein TadG